MRLAPAKCQRLHRRVDVERKSADSKRPPQGWRLGGSRSRRDQRSARLDGFGSNPSGRFHECSLVPAKEAEGLQSSESARKAWADGQRRKIKCQGRRIPKRRISIGSDKLSRNSRGQSQSLMNNWVSTYHSIPTFPNPSKTPQDAASTPRAALAARPGKAGPAL